MGLFPYFWLGLVAFIGVFNLVWAIHDIRTGVARTSWLGRWGAGAKYERSEEPFEFWMSVILRLAGVVVPVFMFYMGLDMLRWK